jgi:ribulose-5-phosphate 4-epimerase/fuculose-1-phosphate aldolase
MGMFSAAQQQVVETAHRLLQKGYLMATGGNLSLRIPGRTAFAITPSNYDYLQMTADDVCVLDFQLGVIAGDHKPSVESGMHAGIYQARADVQAVVHTHQVYASALALIGAPIPALFDEQARFLGRSVAIIPYAPSGTGFLKNMIARHIRDRNNAYILQNHGVICFGHDLERAAHNVEILEKCALAYLLALCTERKVTKIPLAVREIAFAKLRSDQKKAARGEVSMGGE